MCIAHSRLYQDQWLHRYKGQVYRPSQETFTAWDGDVEVVKSKQPLVKKEKHDDNDRVSSAQTTKIRGKYHPTNP